MIKTPLHLLAWCLLTSVAYGQNKNTPPTIQHVNYQPSPRPDRVLLTFGNDPATTATITWRTDSTVSSAKAEIALADPSPEFHHQETEVLAETTIVPDKEGDRHYHKVRFNKLTAGTRYAYRVGDGTHWSEWHQFQTIDSSDPNYRFIYMGDAQNALYSHWSRTIRAAYHQAPDAAFVLHVGDLINHADNDYEWQEWFEAGKFIHAVIPVLAVPGNHEYNKNDKGEKVSMSRFWNPQFNLPQGPDASLQDQAYAVTLPNVLFIGLNSNAALERQALWMDSLLEASTAQWTILAFHHPVFSASKGRVNRGVIEHWLPVILKHKVDLVLQGHDHCYARGPLGETGGTPVAVVSVGGKKMYTLKQQPWMQRFGENIQLYQVVDVTTNSLTLTSYTTAGKVYDAFSIEKNHLGNAKVIGLENDYPAPAAFGKSTGD